MTLPSFRCSPPANKGHDFDLVAFFQNGFVFFSANEPPVQFDGDFAGREVVPLDELRDGGAAGDVLILAVQFDLHDANLMTPPAAHATRRRCT